VITLKRPTGHACAAGDSVQFQQVGVADQVTPLATAPPPAAFVYVDGHAVSGRRIRRRNRHPTGAAPSLPAQRLHQRMRTPRAFASSSDGRRGKWPDRSIRSSTDAFQRRHHRSCSGIRKRPWWSLYLVAYRQLAWSVMRERPLRMSSFLRVVARMPPSTCWSLD
jgi:hypothetical protein